MDREMPVNQPKRLSLVFERSILPCLIRRSRITNSYEPWRLCRKRCGPPSRKPIGQRTSQCLTSSRLEDEYRLFKEPEPSRVNQRWLNQFPGAWAEMADIAS
ncbi:Squamous cell carcinoma antigen recognized by T-cells 3 [Manis javanica]|nr:Squamous cell carcinoma antigen recognized by T-cells 3 [Manis javanica]